ncbi:dipeptide ABC transporter ATP-binding protein [Boseongicola aestuarii]|uniref:Glutathione import ATP-binding protein GsiA n=1 Tax=Boseongicola aestuarii TaxID=1470561 RepID=A0A238J3I8_9RHOB|nr:ABC transporter ATP-binding protein [Boseongicola aestuarii]SMX25248.1 Glutathione import ATP-binding protein GsiA [Boseongicola aestuarii]
MTEPIARPLRSERLPLQISALSVILGGEAAAVPIIDDISLTVGVGEIVGLVGESGSGKSVTCLAALGLLGPDWSLRGDIRIGSAHLDQRSDPRSLTKVRGRDAAMIFQDASASLNPIQKIGKQLTDTVARLQGISRVKARTIALDLLHRVEMPEPEERFHSYPFQLSGGQNQRVMIALALAGQPLLLLADEPTTALDVTVQSQILDLISKLRDDTGMGVVFVTHDLGVVSEVCDRVAVMYSGRIVEAGTVAQIMSAPCHPYTKGLIDSMPTLGGHIPNGIKGQVPSPDKRPVGCAFAPRCFKASTQCSQERPGETTDNHGHSVSCFHSLTEAEGISDVENGGASVAEFPVTEGEPLLSLKSAACDYKTRNGVFRAVAKVSLDLREGESLAVIGESGSGKSTIGKLILGIEPTSEGKAFFGGQQVPLLGTQAHKIFARSVQLVPQNPYLSLDPRAPIGKQIEEPLVIHRIGTARERQAKRNELLEAVGLARAHADRYPHEISGGQCQRAVIARAISLGPKLLICDEATASLDVSVQARIIELLRNLQRQFKLSMVFITHDLRLVRSLCNRVAVMRSGELVELNETELLFAAPRHPYTRELLASIPDVVSESSGHRLSSQ